MKPKLIIYSLFLMMLLWNCNQDDQTQLTPDDERLTDKWAPDVEQQLMQELRQMENAIHEPATRAGRIVTVPAGSEDALAAAIAQAGEGGLVYLRAGEHRESGTVTITQRVRILGENGAVLVVNTVPFNPPVTTVQAALHVNNAPGTSITGVEIRPEGEIGGTGILLENSDGAKIFNCKITGHQFSIINEQSNDAVLFLNTIINSNIWATVPGAQAHGIINTNGDRVRIVGNDVSNALFGIFACDHDGLLASNNMHGNYLGVILCKVPAQALALPSGVLTGAEYSAIGWTVRNNFANGNFDVGYLVIDGANNNLLYGNNASGNARVDYEIVGDSQRFGFFTPFAFENEIRAKSGQTVKDCGEDNVVHGGVKIDTTADPCF